MAIDLGNPTGSGWIASAAADDSPSVFDVSPVVGGADEKPAEKASDKVEPDSDSEDSAVPSAIINADGNADDEGDDESDDDSDDDENEESETPDKPEESEDGKPKDGQGAAADVKGVIEDLPPEKLAEANTQYETEAQNAKDAIALEIAPIALPLIQQREQSQRVIAHIDAKLWKTDANGERVRNTDDDGFAIDLTEPERLLYNEHKTILRETMRDISKVQEALESRVKSAIFEKSLEANLNTYKPLAELKAEVIELVNRGFNPGSPAELFAVAKALREHRTGEKTPAAPQLSKQQVEQAAIEKNIAAKQRAKVSAGKAGASNGKASSGNGKGDLPAHLQAHFDDIARAVSVG